MKVTRCKNCVLYCTPECPIESKPSQMFFCAKGKATNGYKETNGDEVRNMTDRQLAEMVNRLETDAYNHGKNGLRWNLGEGNVKFYTKWFGTPEGEDYHG